MEPLKVIPQYLSIGMRISCSVNFVKLMIFFVKTYFFAQSPLEARSTTLESTSTLPDYKVWEFQKNMLNFTIYSFF